MRFLRHISPSYYKKERGKKKHTVNPTIKINTYAPKNT